MNDTGVPPLLINVKSLALAKAEIERSLATKVKESVPEKLEFGIYFTFEDGSNTGI
jgi:hypothetical protein